ncbi:MAG: asparagine synthase-related protein [Pseudomonadota bacterium]
MPEGRADRQPLADERFLVVADARLDNRDELIAALGLRRPTLADSDILFAGWGRWGRSLFDRVAGSFALAIYDIREKSLILARSPESDRPLCYRVADGELRFASMPSGLLDSAPSLNRAAIARYLLKGDKAQTETFFANIAAVPPGHILEWSRSSQRLQRWWTPAGAAETSPPDAVEEFQHILTESVRSRIRRVSGPLGAQLSGGLDSSAVVATAAGLLESPSELLAYTMEPAPGLPHSIPRNYVTNEGPLASQTARMLGIRHQLVSHRGPLFDCLAGHGRISQEPAHNVINFGWSYEIDRNAVAEGVQVMLVGEKGNSTISYGGIAVLSEWLRRGRFLDYGKQARAVVNSGAARWRGALLYSVIDFLPRWLADLGAGYAPESASNAFLRPEWIERTRELTIGSNYNSPGLRQDQFEMYATNDLGVHKKANLARHGIDERDPSADRRLIEFALRLPAQEFLKDGVTRRLARRALAGRLPASVVNNPLRGYQGADWHAKFDVGHARDWLDEIGLSATAEEVIDLSGIRQALDAADQAAKMPPLALRDWGFRLSRAIAVGAFIREAERDHAIIGRRI